MRFFAVLTTSVPPMTLTTITRTAEIDFGAERGAVLEWMQAEMVAEFGKRAAAGNIIFFCAEPAALEA